MEADSFPTEMTKKQKAYARAGVDVELANKLKRGIQSLVRQTHGLQVLGKIGGFGGLFRASFPGMREPVLVAGIDGEWFCGDSLRIDLERAWEYRHRAVVVVHDVNRGRRFVHGSRDWKTARSFLRDLDVAGVRVTGAAGVSVH